MKDSTEVRLHVTVKYDVEFAGPQVNVIDFYAVNEDGTYCTNLQSLPREVRRQIIEQIVVDAADKDREKSAALEDFSPLDVTGKGVVFA